MGLAGLVAAQEDSGTWRIIMRSEVKDVVDAPTPRRRTAIVCWSLVAVAVILLAYLPVLTHDYGFMDDYRLLLAVVTGHADSFVRTAALEARPLSGEAQVLLYGMSQSIDGLARARAVSLGGIILFCLSLAILFRRSGFTPRLALTAALLLCLTPAVGVWAAWAGLAFSGYAASLALFSGALIRRGLDAPGTTGRTARILAGFFLLQPVFLSYAPLAAFALLAFLAPLLACRHDTRPLSRNLIRSLCVYAGAAAAYFVVCRLTIALFPATGQPSPRLALGAASAVKVKCLASVLWSGLTGWSYLHSAGLQVGVAGITCAAGLLACAAPARPAWRLRPPLAAALGMSVLFSLLPLLVMREADFSFRKQPALPAIVIVTAIAGLGHFLDGLRHAPRARRILETAVCGTLVVGTAVWSHHEVYRGIVSRNAREVALARTQIRPCPASPHHTIRVVQPEPAWLRTDVVGEYGVVSTPMLWAITPMLQLLVAETHGEGRVGGVPGVEGVPLDLVTAPGHRRDVPTVDLFELFQSQRARRVEHPYWGAIRSLPGGWCTSDWFGDFDLRDFPWIRHATLGRLYCAGKGSGSGDFWFRDRHLGWIWTSPDIFPECYVQGRQSWISVSLSFWPEHCFYDYTDKEWVVVP